MLMINRDKMLSLSAGLVGQKVTVKLTTGSVVEGVYHTFTPFQSIDEERRNRYILKEAKVIVRGNNTSTDEALKDGGDGSTLSIPIGKVLHLHAIKVPLDYQNGGSSISAGVVDGTANGFATDGQISGAGAGGTDRELVAAGSAWTTGGGSTGRKFQGLGNGSGGGLNQPVNSRAAALGGPGKATAGSTTSAPNSKGGDLAGSIGQWDQFKANEELFNVNATFDENIYTTQLDTSQIDARKVAEAERIAREIEGTATTNIHLKEERGQKIETDFDEEDLYSGVLTNDMKQRHEAASNSTGAGIKTKKDEKAAQASVDIAKSSTSASSASGTKKMNYAAALAKADTAGKAGPPGFAASSSSSPAPVSTAEKSKDDKKGSAAGPPKESTSEHAATPETAKKDTEKTTKADKAPAPDKADSQAPPELSKGTSKTDSKNKPDQKASDKSSASATKDATQPDEPDNKNNEKKVEASKDETKTDEVKKTSKLNANAKTFTFNPSAKSFTPSFGGASVSGGGVPSSIPVPPQHHPQHIADPNMQMYGGHPMAPPYIATAPMGQPGKFCRSTRQICHADQSSLALPSSVCFESIRRSNSYSLRPLVFAAFCRWNDADNEPSVSRDAVSDTLCNGPTRYANGTPAPCHAADKSCDIDRRS
jgi:LsmAD domain/Ataxin 2 SM domain